MYDPLDDLFPKHKKLTEMNVSIDFYKLPLQKQSIYQIQMRRQAKLQPDLCEDSPHTLWSDWSPVVDVPLGSISTLSVNECCKK